MPRRAIFRASFLRGVLIFILSACAIFFIVGAFTDPAQARGVEATAEESSPQEGEVHRSRLPSELASELPSESKPRRSKALSVHQKWSSHLPSALRTPVFGTEGWQILALVVVFAAGLVLRAVLSFLLRRRLAPVAQNLGAESVGHIVDAFAGPTSTLLVAVLLAAVYPGLGLDAWLESALRILVRGLSLLSVGVALYRVVDVLSDRMASKARETDSKLDDQLVPLLRRALKILVVVVFVLFLLQNLDVNVASLVTGLGIGGVAVALAAKDTIANFFGSLMIFVDRPFQIGDWVKVGETEGIVEEVGFRSTRVRTFYNSLVTVPNAYFTEAAIDNLGLRQFRRTSTTLNLTYDTTPEQMQAFVEGIRAVIAANPSTRKDYYEVHFSAFGAHRLDVMLYFFVKVDSWTDELRERHNIYMEILRLAKDLKVQFAFPTQTLFVESVAQPGEQRPEPQRPADGELAEVVRSFGPGGQRSRPASPLVTHGYLAGNGDPVKKPEQEQRS